MTINRKTAQNRDRFDTVQINYLMPLYSELNVDFKVIFKNWNLQIQCFGFLDFATRDFEKVAAQTHSD